MLFSTDLGIEQPQVNSGIGCTSNVASDSALPALSPVNFIQHSYMQSGLEGDWLCLSSERTDWHNLGTVYVDDQMLNSTDSVSTIPGLGQQLEEGQTIGQIRWISKHKIRGSANLPNKEVSTTVT
ncbi:MAG: hypothetical protein AAF629_06125 [Chloroflexota bacterium]